MKSVAVSQLKANLSRELAIVKAGEEIIVTEHGRPVARLVPVSGSEQEIPARLIALERAGLARLGSGRIPKEFWSAVRPGDAAGKGRVALRNEREEGR